MKHIILTAFAFLGISFIGSGTLLAAEDLTASLSADPTVAEIEEEVVFTATASSETDPDTEITFSGWSCGSDGTLISSNDNVFTCTYSTDGPKTALITATQGSDTFVADATITVNEAEEEEKEEEAPRRRRVGGFAPGFGPNAGITATSGSGTATGDVVTFEGEEYDLDSLTQEEKQNLLQKIVDKIVELALEIISRVLEIIKEEYGDQLPEDADGEATALRGFDLSLV